MNMFHRTILLLAAPGVLWCASMVEAVPIRLDLSPASELDMALTLVGAINATDADASQVTGSIDADIDFDAQGRPYASRIVTADLNTSDVNLSLPLGFPLGTLEVATRNLHLSAFTPDAPPNPPVDSETGLFDLDLHRFRLDGGTAAVESTLYSESLDFAVEPQEFTPLDGMQGQLTQTNGPGGGPVRLVTPVQLSEYVTSVDLGLFGVVDIYVELTGTLYADGFYAPVVVPGDTDGNGTVDLEDLNNVRNNFGGSGLGDTNHDGRVDLDDLNAVRNNFGAGSPVPEPAAWSIGAVGIAVCVWRFLSGRCSPSLAGQVRLDRERRKF